MRRLALTTEQFIQKAQAAHGSRYDYSQTVYRGGKASTIIICLKHGPFEQRPESHIRQMAGCPVCRQRGPCRMAQGDFIAKAQAKHNNRYGYLLVAYEGGSRKVKIDCPRHGMFLQAPSQHLQGKGCPKCNRSNRLTAADFIEKAHATHGSRYDYSRVVYRGSKVKVKIACSIHGVFEQTPEHHANGSGCRKCAGDKQRQAQRWTVEAFITAAQARHGVGTYDYSQVEYEGTERKVSVVCTTHGVFEQTPQAHLAGAGCPHCWKARRGDATRGDTASFIEKAYAKHGVGTYDYSQVEYTLSTKKITIICFKHGEFQQLPGCHLYGDGCQKCAADKRAASDHFDWAGKSAGRLPTLYFVCLFSDTERFYKVGITFSSVEKRFRPGSLSGYQYEVLALHRSNNPARVREWEQSILETFSHLHYKPKLSFAGETECFSSADEILAIFPL